MLELQGFRGGHSAPGRHGLLVEIVKAKFGGEVDSRGPEASWGGKKARRKHAAPKF